jgi:hypothetical protein
MKQVLSLVALLVLAVALTASSNLGVAQSSMPRAESQPHMSTALDHLQQAEKELEAASHDKGGHRVKALSLIKEAISQVQQGIQYDNTHQENPQPRNK